MGVQLNGNAKAGDAEAHSEVAKFVQDIQEGDNVPVIGSSEANQRKKACTRSTG
jgi:hypothetical protein